MPSSLPRKNRRVEEILQTPRQPYLLQMSSTVLRTVVYRYTGYSPSAASEPTPSFEIFGVNRQINSYLNFIHQSEFGLISMGIWLHNCSCPLKNKPHVIADIFDSAHAHLKQCPTCCFMQLKYSLTHSLHDPCWACSNSIYTLS